MDRPAVRTSLLCLMLLSSAAALAEEAVIYRDVRPQETRSGVVELRRAYEVSLPVALPCAEKAGRCAEEQKFEIVYRVDFFEEVRRARPEGLDVERTEQGSIYVAASMDADDERDYEDLLRRLLGSRRASAFAEPLAGLGPGPPPFDLTSIGTRSRASGWVLFDDGGAGDLWVYQRDGGGGESRENSLGGTRIGAPEFVDGFRDAAAAMTSIAAPRTWRTMPAPVEEIEEAVSVVWADRLRGEPKAEELFAWPEGTRVHRSEAPGVTTGGSFRRGPGGCTSEASRMRDGERLASRAVPIALPVGQVADNAWVSRWTVDRSLRRFGALPQEEQSEGAELLMVLLPALPPVDDQESHERNAEPLMQSIFDQQTFFARLAEKLGREEGFDVRQLGAMLADEPSGLVAGGWLMALCGPGRGARYVVPATGAGCTITNADAFCAAAERELRD